jgi:hemoglobin
MIGFLFTGKDRARLVDKEYELAARMLGADIRYTGKPMREAHARVPILGGHFDRRVQLLTNTLADHDVDPEVRRVWLEHTLALRPQITHDRGSECEDPPPKLAIAQPDPPPPEAPIRIGRRPR